MAALVGGLDLTDISDILKEWYVGPTAEQLNQEVMVTQLLDVSDENLEGLQAVLPLHTARSGGLGSRRERAELPVAGKQSYGRAEYDLKYHYARVEVTGQSIQRTNSERGAFLQALKSELSYIRKDIQLDMARQFYGDGTGVIGVVASVSTVTVTLTSAEPIVKGFLYPGMLVDIGAPATPHDVLSADEIVDVDPDGPTITMTSSAAAASAADVVTRAGNVADTTTPGEVDEIDAGLRAIISDDVVGGINPATAGKSYWQGIVEDSVVDLTVDELMRMFNRVNNAGGRADSVVAMTTPGVLRRLFATEDFTEKVRFVDSQTLRGGFEKLSFAAGAGPVALHADRLHPWGEVSFVDKAHVKAFSPADWDFLSRDGLTIRWVADYDAFQALLFRYLNLGTDRRNTSARLIGFEDDGF